MAELYREEGKGLETRWIRAEGSTTDVADLEGKIACTLEVATPPELGCSGRVVGQCWGEEMLGLVQMQVLVQRWKLPLVC